MSGSQSVWMSDLVYSGHNAWSGSLHIIGDRDPIQITSLILYHIQAAPDIDYAYRVFIDSILSQHVGRNLLDDAGPFALEILRQASLEGSRISITGERYDSNGYKQTLTISLHQSCPLWTKRSSTRLCSIKGNYHLTTPLVSGDIVGKVS